MLNLAKQQKKPEPISLVDTAKLKSSERGLSVVKYDLFSGVAVVGWNDNNVVNVVSNAFTPKSTHHVQRYSQKKKQHVLIDRPESIQVYNAGMGGVDLLDGKVAVYRISIRGKKWYWPHFINTLDCLKAASYQLYVISRPDEVCDLTFLQFTRLLTVNLMKAIARPAGHEPMVKMPHYERSAKWKGDNRVCDSLRLDGIGHWPHKGKQRRCALKSCSAKPVTGCDKCGVNLCVHPCYKEWHTKK